MPFVPFIPSPLASDRARELARELETTVERFRQRNPDTSAFEVRQALHLVRRTSGISAKAPLMAAAVGVAVALGIALQSSQRHISPERSPGADGTWWTLPTIGVAVLLLGVLALVFRRK
jgi:hypothetical protein